MIGAINGIVITSNDRYMISAASDCTIKMWDLHLKTCVFTFEKAHTRKSEHIILIFIENIRKLVITNNDEYIVTCADDKLIKVWDLQERKLAHTFEEAHSGNNFNSLYLLN